MKYDCVIVLANEMSQDGTLNDESDARISVAASFVLNRQSDCLICCGWAYRPDTNLTIAEALKRKASTLGVDPDKILCETKSRDTVGDAFFTKRMMVESRKWSEILVVTSDYHVERTRKVFELFYGEEFSIEVVGAGEFDSHEKQEAERKSLLAFEATFEGVRSGDDKALQRRLIENHPFYNGKVHPKLNLI